MEPLVATRSVFYVSDGTGITAEALGHSLLTQFEGVRFKQARIPFVDTPEKAHELILRIEDAGRNDGAKPIVFTTLVNPELAQMVHAANALCLSFIETFVAPMEAELGVKSTHTVGRSHGSIDTTDYKNRIEAINYALEHDDGQATWELEQSDIVIVGAARTPIGSLPSGW